MSFAGSALVAAESILALTPIVIKKTPLDPISAIWSRLLTSAVLGYLLTTDKSLKPNEWAGATALGYTNLLHVATSYEAFRNLPAGQAMSLLYTYPLWNLVFNSFFNNERIATRNYMLIGSAAVGSILLNMDPGIAAPNKLGRAINPTWGLFNGLFMAFTESGMYVLLKGLGWRDPAKSVFVVSTSASIWLGAIIGLQHILFGNVPEFKGTIDDITWLSMFHAVSLFSGYWLRFFAVPRLSTVTYSILSYAGLLAAYIFGIVFLKETPGWLSIVGATIIVASGLAIQMVGATNGDKNSGSGP
jgi:drug/metabolite transporter (DMT)-like permease